MIKKIILAAFLLCYGIGVQAQTTRKVLFLGNSYTYVNDLPQLIKDIATSKGDVLVYDQVVIGGYTFQDHWNNATTYSKIQSNNWDVVIIQGQSQEPSFSPSQVMSFSYPPAKKLADSVRKVNPCTEVMYYMTWGRKNGDAGNCNAYPPVCSYDGMQARLRQSYLMFADSFNASCAPVGVAWKKFRSAYPAVELYQPDESHPSIEGSYLAACVMYSSIFKKNVSGATYYSTLTTTVAQNMQTLAGSTVMDSTSVWNLNSQVPTAGFTYSLVSGSTYQFSNLSVNANSYNWSFGSVQHSPQNTFAGSPPYSVTLTAANSCTSALAVKSIIVTNIQTNQSSCESNLYHCNGQLQVELCDNTENSKLTVYDINGKLIRKYDHVNRSETMDTGSLPPGLYIVYLEQNTKTKIYKFIRD